MHTIPKKDFTAWLFSRWWCVCPVYRRGAWLIRRFPVKFLSRNSYSFVGGARLLQTRASLPVMSTHTPLIADQSRAVHGVARRSIDAASPRLDESAPASSTAPVSESKAGPGDSSPAQCRVYPDPVKSPEDDRSYRVIRLSNGLECTLVSDPTTGRSLHVLPYACTVLN